MKVSFFVGVDVSKATLDVAFCQKETPDVMNHKQFANSTSGCQQLLGWLEKKEISKGECFFIMEHTGWYTLLLCCFLQEKEMPYKLYSPLHLKRSLGLIRGKNDKIDAKRLAHFAFLHRHELQAMQLPSASLLRLKNLFAFRDRLIKTQSSLKVTMQDLKDTSAIIDNSFIIKQSENQLNMIKKQVKETEAQIKDMVEQDKEIKKNLKLLCSVPGIGFVTAIALIIYTQNFSAFEDSRKFASYCGVAPFEYRSGSSIRGQTRISQYANKRVKALLTNGASSAIQHDEEIRAYYQRKIAEGKPKMVVVNAVRAKLINRAFATIRRGTEYVVMKQYGKAA